jgi:hypothetical protein
MSLAILVGVTAVSVIAIILVLRISPRVDSLNDTVNSNSAQRQVQGSCVAEFQADWSVAIGDGLVAQRLQPDAQQLQKAAQEIFAANENLRHVREKCFPNTTTTSATAPTTS